MYSLEALDWIQRFRLQKLHLPPRRMRDVGGDDLEDFEHTGKEFLQYFQEFCYLSKNANVFEIGCGSGRIALPLSEYISQEGRYTGIDIVEPSIRWCNRTIRKRHPNFSFIHLDLYNKRYNPSATIRASDYVFPIDDGSCDFIFLTSVFTHLLPEDLHHYLQEIRRVIRPDGQLFATFFLLNQLQGELQKNERNMIVFHRQDHLHAVRDIFVPESAVAYDEILLVDLFGEVGFSLDQPIKYGSWSGRDEYLSFQDIVVLRPVINDVSLEKHQVVLKKLNQ